MFIIYLLSGLVIGGFIGQYLGDISYLSWLNYGQVFGMTTPLDVDLGVFQILFALEVRFTISGIIGMIIAIIAFRRL